jgi:hypothetical protein
MSRDTDTRVEEVADTLAAIARDLRRPRPSDQTPEESDARLSEQLAALAKELRQAERDVLFKAELIKNELGPEPLGLAPHLPEGWSDGYRAGWVDATAQYHNELKRIHELDAGEVWT